MDSFSETEQVKGKSEDQAGRSKPELKLREVFSLPQAFGVEFI